VHPTTTSREIYDLRAFADQSDLDSTNSTLHDPKSKVDDLTGGGSGSGGGTNSLFAAAVGIGLGSTGLAFGIANSAGSAGFSVASSLGDTAAAISNGVSYFTNSVFGDGRGIYQTLATSEDLAQEIEMLSHLTAELSLRFLPTFLRSITRALSTHKSMCGRTSVSSTEFSLLIVGKLRYAERYLNDLVEVFIAIDACVSVKRHVLTLHCSHEYSGIGCEKDEERGSFTHQDHSLQYFHRL
jgi:hypothetical protein